MCRGTDIKHDTIMVPILDLNSFNFKLNKCYSQRWLCRPRCFLYTHPSELLLGHGSFWYRSSPEILKNLFWYYTSSFWFGGIKFHFSFSISVHFHFKKNERKPKFICHFSKGVNAFKISLFFSRKKRVKLCIKLLLIMYNTKMQPF